MDLRRFLVFFVLIFFILSTSVFSSSIFDVENITHLPYDAKDNDYIIGYNALNKNIFIAVYRSGINVEYFNISENGVYDESGNLLEMYYRTYKPDVGEWGSIAAAHESAPWFANLKPIYSSKDVYNDGQIYIYGKKFDKNLGVFNGLTSSVVFASLLKPFLDLMPFILVFIVLLLSFLKAWNFIKGVFE